MGSFLSTLSRVFLVSYKVLELVKFLLVLGITLAITSFGDFVVCSFN